MKRFMCVYIIFMFWGEYAEISCLKHPWCQHRSPAWLPRGDAPSLALMLRPPGSPVKQVMCCVLSVGSEFAILLHN